MSEGTEAPTPRRIEEARAEGNVAKSIELCAAASLLAGIWLLRISGPGLVEEIKNSLVASLSVPRAGDPSIPWLADIVFAGSRRLAPGLGIFLLGLLVAGVSVNMAQTGFLWAHKRLGFNLSRLNPLEGLKRIFSPQGLMELFKACLKLLLVGWVAYTFLRDRASDMLLLIQTDFSSAIGEWAGLASSLSMRVAFTYLVFALADYGYQRWQYMKRLRMTKEEVKEDFKRSEGDPFIRSRIRGQQRRMARLRMMEKVKKADVVITNPTHLAVAIQYNAGEMSAPKVVAKGAHRIAERIVSLARENQVPVVQNIPIARALYRTVEIDQEVPPHLYVALAEVLAYVYSLRGKTLRPQS
jgi:flagellar biosynthetic protein FlhB